MTETPLILRIRIVLEDIEPPVWRRVLVPADMNLARLHDVIQAAMGWEDYHLHLFHVGDHRYGVPDPTFEDPEFKVYRDANIKLEDLVRRGIDRFTYTYDFGDNWIHDVIIEKSVAADPDVLYPAYVDGERQCPPEDVGGFPGYYEFLDAISDPTHEEHEHLLEWVGESFDPEEFDVYRIQLGMENIARARRPGPRKRRP
jgi:hypothetical protein